MSSTAAQSAALLGDADEHFVAIDDVCAWPNLLVLPDGAVGAFIHNQPGHGTEDSDIELWVSPDGRAPWTRRSAVTLHEPDYPRFNVAAGAGLSGVVIALVGGVQWSKPDPVRTNNLLHPLVCRSFDAGHTWERGDSFQPPTDAGRFVPFGNVRVGQDGALYASAYDCRMSSTAPESRLSSSYVFRSGDNGLTWTSACLIARDRFTETDIVQTAAGDWLAAARTLTDYARPTLPGSSPSVMLFQRAAGGHVWEEAQQLTVPSQYPGNLLVLQDGRLLFTCGSRIPGYHGVFAKISDDGGVTWAFLRTLVTAPSLGDCGYPSSVQLADGTLVTGYYASRAPYHHNYHLAVIRWRL